MPEHSEKFDKVLNYYNRKLWTLKQVRAAVGRWITKEEYQEITGEVY